MGEVETIQSGSAVSNLTNNLLEFLRTVGFTFLNGANTNGLEVCHILEMFKRIKRCPRMFVDCLLSGSSGKSPRAGRQLQTKGGQSISKALQAKGGGDAVWGFCGM